jgi:cell division protease FtsH
MQENAFTKPYSDETAKMIDQEVRKLIDDAYEKTKSLLMSKREDVEKLANALLEKEVLFQSDVEALIGKRPFEEKKALSADEVPADSPWNSSAVTTPAAHDDKSTDGQTGNLGFAPSL